MLWYCDVGYVLSWLFLQQIKTMRSLLFFAFLFVFTVSSCKKTEYVDESAASYDTQFKIFRVKVKSELNTPYSVSIKRGKSTETFDNIEVDQKTGIAFEYGFTPSVGETISVVVKSLKNDIKPFAFYKGEYSFPLELKQTANGYIGEFTYKVEN